MALGISGKTAQAFQNSAITPLLALVGLLLGFFAIMVTPKEEEPQIDVTLPTSLSAFPGASARQVEQLVFHPRPAGAGRNQRRGRYFLHQHARPVGADRGL